MAQADLEKRKRVEQHMRLGPYPHERPFISPKYQSIPFFYTTHTYYALILALIPLVYSIIYPPMDERESSKRILGIFLYVFMIIGSMVFPSGPFVRPHPVFWRWIFGISVIYAFILMYLILLPLGKERQWLKMYVDDSLGKPITLPLYAQNCWPLTFEKIWNACDRFVIAHFVGWFMKALLIRHRLMLWCMSFFWELLELSFVYYIPNFGECEWDQWILDFLICNGLGIEFGLAVCHYLEFSHPKYYWCDIFEYRAVSDKIKRFLFQFTPKDWMNVEYEEPKTLKSYLHINFIFCLFAAIELNAFLLKLYLWIPTEHILNPIRLLLIGSFTTPAVRQYFYYIKNYKHYQSNRVGSFVFMLLFICALEMILIYKTAPNDIPPPPLINKIMWAVSIILYLIFSWILFIKGPKITKNTIKSDKKIQ